MTESDSDTSFVSADDEDDDEFDPSKKRKTKHRGHTGDIAEAIRELSPEFGAKDTVSEIGKIGKKVTLVEQAKSLDISNLLEEDTTCTKSSKDPKRVNFNEDKITNTGRNTIPQTATATSQGATSPGPSTANSSWGWPSWGTAIVSTATASVTTFKQQVGEGLSTVLGTVENTFGAPTPEDMAASVRQGERRQSPNRTEIDASNEAVISVDVGGISEELSILGRGLFSTVTSALEATGSRVIQTSLDTLEIIGKKTMDVIQEGDPGLKKKRAAINSSLKPQSLSEALREAKEKSEKIEHTDAGNRAERKKVNYSTVFDEYHGLVHLEALEMISQQNDTKVNSILTSLLSLKQRDEMEPEIAEITAICELVDPDSLDCSKACNEVAVCEQLKSLGSNLLFEKLFEIYNRGNDALSNWPKNIEPEFIKEKHDTMIKLLAEITAKAVEILHKLAELLLLPQFMSKKKIANNLSDFSLCVCCKINSLAGKFSEQCNLQMKQSTQDSDKISALITNVFLEASNSCSYVQDALKLVVPVLNYTVAREILDRT